MIKVVPFQLLQWRAWIRAEQRAGRAFRHSSGRSVRAHAARTFGLSPRAPRAEILGHIEAALAACEEAGVEATTMVELIPGPLPN